MQTFLPYPSFKASARIFDYRRLGKQRIEVKQLVMTLEGTSIGWRHHPCVKQWRGYHQALCRYGLAMCDEWIRRGYVDTTRPFFVERMTTAPDEQTRPPWLGSVEYHLSHQSNLIRKDRDFYEHLFPYVTDDLLYVWPVGKEEE